MGFAGVLVVLRPTGRGALTLSGPGPPRRALTYAASAITVRVLGPTDTSQGMVFWLMAMVAAGAGPPALPGWRPIQSALVWGVGLDWTLWRTLPGPITFLGAGVIIVSGST